MKKVMEKEIRTRKREATELKKMTGRIRKKNWHHITQIDVDGKIELSVWGTWDKHQSR